ncbi:TBC1 domain family member 13-like [Sycon ciliatum]|uniref:TBC1 domain family member 13-like n=1 Tax=Sycon ciliatum TaxID=27933 RepID=UPI0031F5F304|eukprot:scpid48727/ scgid9808/ TBC1 domain family member 13
MSAVYKQRVAEVDQLLAEPKLDFKKVRAFSFDHGIPEGAGRRATVWKILLDYLPCDVSEWPKCLAKTRKTYQEFVEEIIINPHEQANNDHPLNPNPDSQWNAYFKDNGILGQIDKDVRRLCPDISFFQQATPYPCPSLAMGKLQGIESLSERVERTCLESAQVETSRMGLTRNATAHKIPEEEIEPYKLLPKGQEAHWQVVERILFIYAKLNPGIGYVQGMNEVIGPIYYVFAGNTPPEWQEHAEADAFFCFTSIMSEIKDNFIKTLDDSACGIGAMMVQLMELLQKCDKPLHDLLVEKQHLSPQFYAFRWLTLLLSQEFQLPDLIRLWDSFLAERSCFDFLIYTCCAMIVVQRDKLMENDFAHNMKLLQNYPDIDVHVLLRKAIEIKERYELEHQDVLAR